jgi:hypothetical protein
VEDASIPCEEPSLGGGDDVGHGGDAILERHSVYPLGSVMRQEELTPLRR